MDELKKIASNIKLVGFDVDGVLTNGDITYTSTGEELKTFNAKDGQGINLMVKKGIVVAIITARKSPIVDLRAKDLGITHVYQGAKNKIEKMTELAKSLNIDFSQIAYMGDDLPDICVLEKIALACCPNDAVEEVKRACNFISTKPGGKGAARELSNFILANTKEKVAGGVSLPTFNR